MRKIKTKINGTEKSQASNFLSCDSRKSKMAVVNGNYFFENGGHQNRSKCGRTSSTYFLRELNAFYPRSCEGLGAWLWLQQVNSWSTKRPKFNFVLEGRTYGALCSMHRHIHQGKPTCTRPSSVLKYNYSGSSAPPAKYEHVDCMQQQLRSIMRTDIIGRADKKHF